MNHVLPHAASVASLEPLSLSERDELRQLRKEIAQLRMERDI